MKNRKIVWDELVSKGKKNGYYVKGKKYWIILKYEARLEVTENVFHGTEIKITTE